MTSPRSTEGASTALAGSLPPPLGLDPAALPLDPEPLVRQGRNWANWVGGAISLLILAVALWQWRSFDVAGLLRLVPAAPLFWPLFVLYYIGGPLGDWLIFRHLWRIPFSGILPLLRKQVANELLLGYSGELYFYSWARRNGSVPAAPFGAIKDVTILSAMVGNVVTLVLLILAAPLFSNLLRSLDLNLDAGTLAVSVGFVLATSLIVLALRRRLFSLPRRELWYISAIHLGRILVTVGLTAWLWHLALPMVALSWWLLLSTWRQLIARLPFLPNKDVVFAALAIFLVGQDRAIADLMAMMAALILGAHLIVGTLLALMHFTRLEKSI